MRQNIVAFASNIYDIGTHILRQWLDNVQVLVTKQNGWYLVVVFKIAIKYSRYAHSSRRHVEKSSRKQAHGALANTKV